MDYIDFSKLRKERNWHEWYTEKATAQERLLSDLISDYSERYFSDFRFQPHTVVDSFAKVQMLDDDGKTWDDDYVEIPEILLYFKKNVLQSVRYKVDRLDDDTIGCVDHEEVSITISPEYVNDEDGKPIILHELIHIYELAIDQLPKFYHDILFLSLYKSLKETISDLDDRIIDHAHTYTGMETYRDGGNHDILFFLKSLDLDLRCNYTLGSVCGYGRDEFDKE